MGTTTRRKDFLFVAPVMLLSPPPGFTERHAGRYTWWLKTDGETRLQPILARLATATNVAGGRGTVERVTLCEDVTVAIRRYYRGGFVRHFIRNVYWDRPPRPFAELVCTETARLRAVPTVEPLAAGVEWIGGGLYRGILITREAQGFVTLWDWLRTQPTDPERTAMLTTVAHATARLHEAGIVHADLNLTNILVGSSTGTPSALVIDFDRARILPAPVPLRRRNQNLHRLRRSLDKLDPGGLFSVSTDFAVFCQAYDQGDTPV